MQQRSGRSRPPIGIAFDGDVGNRIDALMVLAMLNGFTAKAEARRIAISVSRPSLASVQLADVVSTFYRPPAAGRGVGVGAISEGMIGMAGGRGSSSDAPALAPTLAKKNADGTPLYTSGITDPINTAESAVLIRNLLLAQHDGNAAIIVAGPATGVARILGLYRAGEQLKAKCRHLVIAAGAFGTSSQPEASIAADVSAARTLFAEWPTPIVAVGSEVGQALPYPGASIEKDFAWAPAHPIVDAYRALKPMPYDAPAAALAAALYAVHADKNYFTLSEPGTISVLDDGRTRFAPGADGKHRFLIVDPAQKETVISAYTALVSAPPAPRPTAR